MYNRDKVQTELDKIQTGCKARLLTIGDIEKEIGWAEKWIKEKKLPSEVCKYVRYEHFETVPNSYRNAADATYLYLTFTTKGKVKEVTVVRKYTHLQPRGGNVSRFHLNAKVLFETEYDLNFYTDNEKQKSMFNRYIRNLGFNPGTLTGHY